MEFNDYDGVADLYDIYVPLTYDLDFFLKETKKSAGEVLELMSGTGRVSIPLLQAGVRLTCVDVSAASNAVLEGKLRRLGLKADVYTQDICALDLPRQFDMIVIPFHSFAHLVSPADQRRALERIARHLLPGGTFICTLGNPAVRQQDVDGQLRLVRTYALPDTGGRLLLWIVENNNSEDPKVVEALQFFEEYDARGVMKSKRLLELHFRLTPRDEFEALAQSAGFMVQALYGDYAYAKFNAADSPSLVWVLRRAG